MKKNITHRLIFIALVLGCFLFSSSKKLQQDSIPEKNVQNVVLEDSIPELDMLNYAIYDTVFGSYLRHEYISEDKIPYMVIYNRNDTTFIDLSDPFYLPKLPYNGYFTHNGIKCLVLNNTETNIPHKENGQPLVISYKDKGQLLNNGTDFFYITPTVTPPLIYRYSITNNGKRFKNILIEGL